MNIPITISPFFWLLAVALGWFNTLTIEGTAIWMGVIFISLMVHEYGHALTAVLFGQRAHIQLTGFGGLTLRSGKKLKPWQEFIIVLNGPLAGFGLCLVAFWAKGVLAASESHQLLSYAISVAFVINLFWTILNLIPVQPLDGSKLLGIVLESLWGVRGTKIALFISLILALALGVAFFISQSFLAGSIFLLFAYESYRAWKESLKVTKQDQDFVLHVLLEEAEKDMRAKDNEKALKSFEHIRNITKEGIIYITATEYAANILTAKGEFQEAYLMLNPISSKLSNDATRLLHQLSYQQGYWKEAVSLGKRVYHLFPSSDTAVINALCYSLLGEVAPSIGWLQCAIRDGIPNVRELLARKEFDNIRQDPQFQQLQTRSAK